MKTFHTGMARPSKVPFGSFKTGPSKVPATQSAERKSWDARSRSMLNPPDIAPATATERILTVAGGMGLSDFEGGARTYLAIQPKVMVIGS